jgi:hypothetical protein
VYGLEKLIDRRRGRDAHPLADTWRHDLSFNGMGKSGNVFVVTLELIREQGRHVYVNLGRILVQRGVVVHDESMPNLR